MSGAVEPRAVEQAAQIAAQQEADTAAYLGRVRTAIGRLAVTAGPDDVRSALIAVEDSARIDVDLPIASSHRGVAQVKSVVKRLTAGYLVYIGQQVTLLGQAVARLGAALAERTDRLEESTEALRGDIAELEARVERLEAESDRR